MTRVILGATVALAALAAFAGPRAETAFACSCGGVEPSRDLPRVDAAFVGTVAAQRVEGSLAFWTFDVERAIKGHLPARIVVRSAADGASCGLEPVDGRTGLLVNYEHGAYESGLCYQTDAEVLARYALPNARVVGRSSEGSGWPWWPLVVGAGAAVTLIVGLLSLRRRN